MKLLLSLLIFFHGFLLYAQNLDISEPKLSYIGQKMLIYNDKDLNHSLEYLQKNIDLFKSLNKDIDSRFFTQDTIWYHFKVNNPTSEQLERYFVLDMPWFDNMEIYIQHENSQNYYQGGNQFVFSKRSYATNLINIKHSFEKGISEVYIKAKTHDPFVFALSLIDHENLIQQSAQKHTISFSIYSIIFTMMLFNFILYFIIKHSSYLYYSLFLFSFLCMNMAYNNYTFEYILGENPLLQNCIEGLFLYIFSIVGLLFTQSFLEFKQNYPRLYQITQFLMLSFIVITLFFGLFAYNFFVAAGIFTTFIFGLYSLCVAIYCIRQKNRSAIFFVLGVSFGLVGTMITGLSVSAIIPTFNIHMYKAVDYGLVIDTILLSIALAKRYTILFENLKKTQNELLQVNTHLEKIVEERTLFLSRELENNKLLLKEMFHRVKNNLQIISSLLSLQTKNITNPLLIRPILEENIQRIHAISMLHEKIFQSKDLKEIPIKSYIKEILLDFIDITGFNQLNFQLNVQNISISANNLIPFGLVINELLTNSFKYAFNENYPSPTITIELYTEENHLVFCYRDNGKGADLEKFSQGFGINLLESLCRHQLRGEVHYFNQKGFNYQILFPKNSLF
jgi:two-component sensor histidine kinase